MRFHERTVEVRDDAAPERGFAEGMLEELFFPGRDGIRLCGEMAEQRLRRISVEKARSLRADHFRACKHGVCGKLEPDGIVLRYGSENPRVGGTDLQKLELQRIGDVAREHLEKVPDARKGAALEKGVEDVQNALF